VPNYARYPGLLGPRTIELILAGHGRANVVKLIRPDVLEGLVQTIFERAGAGPENSVVVAQHLVSSNLAGHASHGVIRVPEYLRDIDGGVLDPAAVPEVQIRSPLVALVDGHSGFGQVAGVAATRAGIELAAAAGMSAVGVVRCHHLGRMGDYVERAADADCVMFVTAAGHPGLAVAYGGRGRLLGANPIAAGFPAGDEPFILDIATTTVAAGKVRVAAARGDQVPPGVLVDSAGQPTTDPAAFAAGGALTPFGGHKGFALAVLSELLTTALVGSPRDEAPLGGTFARQAALFVTLRVDLWRSGQDATEAAESRLNWIRSSDTSEPGHPVQVPGDPERAARRKYAAGVPVDEESLDALVGLAHKLSIEVPGGLVAG
jgi:hydroxycarboxylate dehydrogenase B